MRRLLAATFVWALLAPATLAQAQSPARPKADKPRVELVEMEELRIRGKRHGPGGVVFITRRRPELERMLDLRRSFIPEILKSAEALALE